MDDRALKSKTEMRKMVLVLFCHVVASAAVAEVAVSDTGAVSVGGKEWLSAASPRLFCDGTWLPLANGSLAAAPVHGSQGCVQRAAFRCVRR